MTPILIVVVIGVIAGLVLSIAAKVFYVEVDETQAKVREVLPGANCGACGCAGCDEYAAKLAKGEAEPNLCTVGGAAVAAQIGEILG
ncbi:MAG: ferredoxin, partial [Oscillospiraceae bacterium]|nr:ferredoxin [Oscillospiraceae bacterium]